MTMHRPIPTASSIAAIVLALSLAACQESSAPGDQTPVIATGWNIAKVRAGESISIPISATANGTPMQFASSSTGDCATVTQTAAGVSVSGETANCVDTVTVTAGNTTETITLNVYDPTSMDIGEGLLISYVNGYQWRWADNNSGGSIDVTFWHPIVPAGWYAIGSLVVPHYGDINVTKDYPMIIVRDISAAQNLLAAPNGYTRIWDDGGSGASADGSIWKPNCPAGYVSLGSVVNSGHGAPSNDDTRCVAQRFTTPGTVGAFLYNDNGTGANIDVSAWRVGPSLLGASPDGRYAMSARASVGCAGWNATTDCEPSQFNLLLVPLPVMENSDDNAIEPRLTGYTGFVPSSAVFFANVRIPFTLLPSEDPLCGTDACTGAATRVNANVTTTPFYYLERHESYAQLGSAIDNRQGTTPVPLGPYTYTNAFSETDATSFSQEIGMTITVNGGASFLGTGTTYSVELSTKLAWSQSHSQTYSQAQVSAFGPFQVQPGDFGQVLQVTTQFRARSEQGNVTGSVFGMGQNTAKFLRYPLN